MKKLASLLAAAAMVAVFGFAGTAWAVPDDLYPRHAGLEADGDWLIAHFDDRDGVFDDGADVSFIGKLPDHKHTDFEVGEFTVEASAAWDWTKWTAEHPAAPVYAGFSVYSLTDNDPISMPPLHQHANCRTDSGGEDHEFDATVRITTEHGEINADIVGGVNIERLINNEAEGHDPDCETIGGEAIGGSPPAYDGTHTESENEVLIYFEFDGSENSCEYENVSGGGVLQWAYNTAEPHELLEASIILNLEGEQLPDTCDL